MAGTLADDEHVLIDIGTGYYAQKVTERREFRRIRLILEIWDSECGHVLIVFLLLLFFY